MRLGTSRRPRLVLNVHKSVPAETIREFLASAKSQPGKLAFASAGVGNAPHLAGEQFHIAAGIDVLHVPYKRGAAVFTDLPAGRSAIKAFYLRNGTFDGSHGGLQQRVRE